MARKQKREKKKKTHFLSSGGMAGSPAAWELSMFLSFFLDPFPFSLFLFCFLKGFPNCSYFPSFSLSGQLPGCQVGGWVGSVGGSGGVAAWQPGSRDKEK